MHKYKSVGNATVELPHHILGLAGFRHGGGIRLQDTNIMPLRFVSIDRGADRSIYGIASVILVDGIKLTNQLAAGK